MSKYCFKEYIQDLLKKSGLSQKSFSEQLKIGHSTLKDVIRGKTSMPQPPFLEALAKYTKESKYKVLQNIVFYKYEDLISSDEDFDALTLYACYLYTKEWSFVNTNPITKHKLIINNEAVNTETETNVSLKKSVYPDRAILLENYKAWDFDTPDKYYGLYSILENIEEKNISAVKGYNFISFDIVFVYDNNKKNNTFINKIDIKKMLKPDHCNSISFILFDRKTFKIVKKINN